MRLLQAPISIDDELPGCDLVDDASSWKILILVICDRWRNRSPFQLCGAELLPFFPDVVVPAGMSQEIAVRLCFREWACVSNEYPGVSGVRNAPKDSYTTGHQELPWMRTAERPLPYSNEGPRNCLVFPRKFGCDV